MAADPFLDSDLHKFLHDNKARAGGEMSMTAIDPGGKWFVPDNKYEHFFDLLHEWLFVKKGAPRTLVEKRLPDGRTPLLIDLDFRYPSGRSVTHSFGKEHIFTFVQEVNDCITKFFDLKDTTYIRYFVTLRPQAYIPKKNGPIKELKDGVHIISPDIVLSKEQQKVLRLYLLEKEAVTNSFADTGYTNDDEGVFDETLTNTQGWQFYGESKKDAEHPYVLTNVFRYKVKVAKFSEEKLETYNDTRDLMGLFSIRYGIGEPVKVKEDAVGEYEEYYKKTSKPLEPVNTVVQHAHDGIEEWANVLATVTPESEIAKAKKLVLECLSEKRANDYDSWIKVGWCIRNIDPSSEGFDLWMEFSKKSPKYNSNSLESLRRDWIKGSIVRIGEVRRIDFGSLVRWAKEDNLEKFDQIMKADILNYIRRVALSFDGGTHHHVAEIMKRVFGDTYKCSVETRGHEWYRFVKNVWEPQPQGVELKKKMSDDIVELVSDAREVYKKMANDANTGKHLDLEKEDEINKNCKKFLKLQLNLYSANYKDSCLKECIQTFYEESFAQKMNKNLYTVGCANGVLHLRDPVYEADGKTLKEYTVTFKQGMPEDHISFQAGNRQPELDPLDYVPYDPENPEMAELLDFFEKIFPNAELREYILLLASSCLEGSNREQCYYIMTGSGGNGKSKFVDLMQNTFGDYCGSLSTAALTRKRPDSGAANPDIVNIKNKRFIAMQEPDEREQLNVARMKQFSGEDIVEARGLFKDQETFKITGKFFMSCNRLPPINSMDDGTWRRLRVIPFTSKFLPVGDSAIDPANGKYPRDPFLDDKLKRWRTTFFGYLVHLYKTKYMKEGIKSVPKEVKKYSEEYKQSYDSFSKFRFARIRDVTSVKQERREELLDENVIFKQIKSSYRMWSNDSSNSKPISDNELLIRCQDAFGVPADGKTYKGIKLFNSDEDAEEWDKGVVDES